MWLNCLLIIIKGIENTLERKGKLNEKRKIIH